MKSMHRVVIAGLSLAALPSWAAPAPKRGSGPVASVELAIEQAPSASVQLPTSVPPSRIVTVPAAVVASGAEATETVSRTSPPNGAGFDELETVVVVGEQPYAEMRGDRASLELDPEDIAVVKKVKASVLPSVVLFPTN